MNSQKKPDTTRGEIAFIFAIVIGLLLGLAIRRIKIGILIGIALGLLIVFMGALKSSKR